MGVKPSMADGRTYLSHRPSAFRRWPSAIGHQPSAIFLSRSFCLSLSVTGAAFFFGAAFLAAEAPFFVAAVFFAAAFTPAAFFFGADAAFGFAFAVFFMAMVITSFVKTEPSLSGS